MKFTNELKNAVIVLLTVIFIGCEHTEPEIVKTNRNIEGYVQKGPYLNGSSITIYDLNARLNPTGIAFDAQITNNEGRFTINEIPLSSNYIKIRANGFYFNEILGKKSDAQLTLYAISNIANNSNINVNLLTHLEKSRVEFLIHDSLMSFNEAKIQTQREILSIFNIARDSIPFSENLDISESGDENGILLALTAILQGFRTEGELSELLANISNDILEDGVLDNPTLGSSLINQALYLDSTDIKLKLENRYKEIGIEKAVPRFGSYITHFINNTNFEITEKLIKYPSTGNYGNNILDLNRLEYVSGRENPYSLAADLPKGTALKIKISSLSTSSTYRSKLDSIAQANNGDRMALWLYKPASNVNWSVQTFDKKNYTQIFTAIEADKSCDLSLFFEKGQFLIEYFEMGSEKVSRSKIIHAN